jgi:RimJ/RimL family protein N-acetyltransferase
MNTYQIFESKRLFLRPTLEMDADLLIELFNTPKWFMYMGDRNIRSVENAENYIRDKMIAQLERSGFSSYTLIRKSDGQKVGICGLFDRDGFSGIDLGFALLPRFERLGYAHEASEKLIDLAFNTFDLDEINAWVAPENRNSRKLIKKLGMVYRKTIGLAESEEKILLFNLKKAQYQKKIDHDGDRMKTLLKLAVW